MFSFEPDDKSQEKLARSEIKLTGDIARQCLAMTQFKSYRKRYETAEKKIVDTLLSLTNLYQKGGMDITNYGSRVLAYTIELKSLRSLLVQIEHDSKKGLNDGGE